MPISSLEQAQSEEPELVARARSKDASAVALIIRQHNQRLYRIARSILRDDFEAEDALQEAYIRAFTRLDSFRGEARLGTWLARIVMNEALGRLRRRKPSVDFDAFAKAQEKSAQIIRFPAANPELDPETTMAQREIRALLERAIDALPEAFRTVLVARLIEGMSIEETAELFWDPAGNGEDASAPGPRTPEARDGKACRSGPGRRLPVRRPPLRAAHRDCADPARPS